jgi:hypothetical protein
VVDQTPAAPPAAPADEGFYSAAERRIERFTVVIGLLGALVGWMVAGFRIAAAVAGGAALSWINYRWMKQGVHVLAQLSTVQAGEDKPRVPKRVYFKAVGRYALLILAAYVILRGLKLPVMGLIAGFFAVVAAVLVELVGQLFRSGPLPRADA